jgi:hypothetical protein
MGKEKVEQSIPTGEDVQSDVAKEVIKIDNNDVVMRDCFKGPIIISSSAQTQIGNNSGSSQPWANDHEASSSKTDPKYHWPRWCPGGLTHTEKRKLQRMRSQEKEQESELQRDEFFNKLRSMVSRQQWKGKTVSEALKDTRVEAVEEWGVADTAVSGENEVNRSNRLATPVGPVDEGYGPDRSGWLVTPVRPVNEASAQIEEEVLAPSQSCSMISSPTDNEEEMLDYEPLSVREDMDVNVIYLSSVDYSLVGDDEVVEMSFGPHDAVFQRPKDWKNHLKLLYIQGHLDGKPISQMLIDGGTIINLMSYSFFKKVGKSDEELIKTNMSFNGVGGADPIGAKGVSSMELTVGSKTLATTFFIAEVQANYSVILGQDWIQANHCIPSTLHQFFIQWAGDGEDVVVVHADTSTCVAMANYSIWTHEDVKCLSGLDLLDYGFLSVYKDGFVPIHVKLVENRLNHTCC